MGEWLRSDGVIALRRWRRRDAEALVACIDGDPEIGRWLDRIPQPYTPADALAFISGIGETAFAVVDERSGRLVGGVGLRWAEDVAEIGYWARADARGRGLTTRALVLAAGIAFADGAARVQLRADVENAASRRVAEKAGFTAEGVLREAHWNPRLGRRQSWVMYSLLPGER
ncbi:MAG: GNAT family N-acetyltransferase [Acidobacteriota bacterium]|nr:GNAT family N-acetyltransferase [Acidobacteriota bacterium]